ncbi:hypothetical protein PTTG_10831 [Puccinia triticina 1-1 BBBD Race 1]|uniref:Uncharacterized protein n=1 Tax=Puccinia triticina (isolate 1-1 / race 1 (BBBD)) TaxID=630390 RepID=A0A0C4FC79_PUCT1|nr:hypothetical protein PTTG_10831 [Puccinia triticina 1-1 BBBD Race 1]
MHGNNAATVAYEHEKMNNSMEALVADIGPEAGGEAGGNTPIANTDDVQAARDCQGTVGLTAAEDELDPQTGHKDNSSWHFDAASQVLSHPQPTHAHL